MALQDGTLEQFEQAIDGRGGPCDASWDGNPADMAGELVDEVRLLRTICADNGIALDPDVPA